MSHCGLIAVQFWSLNCRRITNKDISSTASIGAPFRWDFYFQFINFSFTFDIAKFIRSCTSAILNKCNFFARVSYRFLSKLPSIFFAVATAFVEYFNVRSAIFFSAILWDLEGPGRGRECPYTTRSSCAEIGNNPINQGTPAGAITFHGWTQLAEPNPSRKYCPLRTDAASSPGPRRFFHSRFPLLFFLRSHDPAATQGIFLVCIVPGLSTIFVPHPPCEHLVFFYYRPPFSSRTRTP